ncbi:hypothetical protein P153DRAFT_420270 [Dothidotthia symphoricarpi CBS 119687]|uniref:C2H2-type domain-containing protein n=1 Tax=Dothidotthia symphoricarpi CBS 119687 TaxID=1392245 RepID=A0A6A6AQV3_9PLEO|nr:uncharacterized protein P153DRAFT_420270 [Dothidotthia symphoricarpi CBS 119687]KAF2133385.1 hypothetical protein P153DRAFT_420270 [Dothidotthia symphoricarpi CBS 119687]
MGNAQGREARPSGGHVRRSSAHTNPTSPTTSGSAGPSQDRAGSGMYASRSGRGSRHDLTFLGIGAPPGSEQRDLALEPRRETKAEREARKLEKERVLRAQERERSLREEGVDGGFLVTLGTYTGPEDFSKPVVRQLQIERRIAPFWKGLDDHEDTWTEHQLVAIVNGRPLPAPDDIPPDDPPQPSTRLSPAWNARSSDSNINNLTVPMGSRSMSQNSDQSTGLSPLHPASSLPPPVSPMYSNSSTSPFFRSRAKTLASLATGSRNASQTEMVPQEVQLPRDPYVNGHRVEAFLYKNVVECPICCLYYPPYLNKTRCCDQHICSECFVQLKRPDPHPPEHHGEAPTPSAEPQEEIQLVSEPATCPFCKQPEFGVTYESPYFRRGLAYAGQTQHNTSIVNPGTSSNSSLGSPGASSQGRRRAESLAVTDKAVITTDLVRPDWAKKLADAKSLAMRRSAAATALHTAAYMQGVLQQEGRGFRLGGRRRPMFNTDSAGSSGQGTPRGDGEGSSGRNPEGSHDFYPGRHSARGGNRADELEELMMMEAIRLSLAAEDERKRKGEKDAAKEAKKEGKKKAKEAKKVAKAQKNIGSGFHPISVGGLDDSGAGSSSVAGKGKAIDRSGNPYGFNPSGESSSAAINSSPSRDDPQKHLESSRAQIQGKTSGSGNLMPYDPLDNEQSSHRAALGRLSNPSSSSSSFAESDQDSPRRRSRESRSNVMPGQFNESNRNGSGVSLNQDETSAQGTPGTEPMFNFQSLTDAITHDNDDKDRNGAQHIEHVAEAKPTTGKGASANSAAPEAFGRLGDGPPIRRHDTERDGAAGTARHGDKESSPRFDSETSETLGASVATIKPSNATHDDDEIAPAPPVELVADNLSFDRKHIGDVSTRSQLTHQATQ